MAKASSVPGWQTALVLLTSTVVSVVVVAALYWIQIVFIPVAMAVFLTFLLTPLVKLFQRGGIGRVPSVLAVVLLSGLVIGATGWIVSRQVSALLTELPNYTANIKQRAKALRELGEGDTLARLKHMMEEITGEFKPKTDVPGALEEGMSGETPIQDKAIIPMAKEGASWLPEVPFYFRSVLEAGAGVALTFVLLLFMLLNREDLRNRFIRLVGHGHVTSTTKAVDDAGHRISRFLVIQAVINGGFGLVLSIGLLLLRVDYALLWGFLAAVLRYVPYVGIWMAIVFPITLSLAMFEGWFQPVALIALFAALELIASNWVEPRLFGHSMGVSEVALLIFAAFWAFLWGPVGLVLSAPLTVCLVVLGKYVSKLGFLDVLMGDQLALSADVSFYQRLLARDQDEATELVLARVKASPAENVYDEMLIPALNHSRQDHGRDDLGDGDVEFIHQAIREVLEDVGEHRLTGPSNDRKDTKEGPDIAAFGPLVVLGCPARDEADRLGLEMVRQVLDGERWQLEIAGSEALTAELAARVAEEKPVLVLIGSVPPGGLAHTRYLCKRLRGSAPNVRIMVGRWGSKGDLEESMEQLTEAGADLVTTSILETRTALNAWLSVLVSEQGKPPVENGADIRHVGLSRARALTPVVGN